MRRSKSCFQISWPFLEFCWWQMAYGCMCLPLLEILIFISFLFFYQFESCWDSRPPRWVFLGVSVVAMVGLGATIVDVEATTLLPLFCLPPTCTAGQSTVNQHFALCQLLPHLLAHSLMLLATPCGWSDGIWTNQDDCDWWWCLREHPRVRGRCLCFGPDPVLVDSRALYKGCSLHKSQPPRQLTLLRPLCTSSPLLHQMLHRCITPIVGVFGVLPSSSYLVHAPQHQYCTTWKCVF